jgi:hypothetical protein
MIHEHFFKPTYLIQFDKIIKGYRNSCLKTVNESSSSIDDDLKDEINKSSIDEFVSNQFFIYLYGLRFTGLNYLTYIFIYIGINIYVYQFTRAEPEKIYEIYKYLSWTIVLLITTFGKLIMSSFTSTRKWTYVNNFRLYNQILANKGSEL